jgi:hypothetical protein
MKTKFKQQQNLNIMKKTKILTYRYSSEKAEEVQLCSETSLTQAMNLLEQGRIDFFKIVEGNPNDGNDYSIIEITLSAENEIITNGTEMSVYE